MLTARARTVDPHRRRLTKSLGPHLDAVVVDESLRLGVKLFRRDILERFGARVVTVGGGVAASGSSDMSAFVSSVLTDKATTFDVVLR